MFCDLKSLTVEELVGRLRAAENRLEEKVDQITDKAGHLLLAEEDWFVKHKHRFQSGLSREGNNGGSSGGHGKSKSSVKSNGGGSSGGQGAVKLMSMGTPDVEIVTSMVIGPRIVNDPRRRRKRRRGRRRTLQSVQLIIPH